ncbi:uncharacterized protein B0I36DRAFT_330669 [Microdochium trichocladiopsis]|uniref:Uncharacterized protein n=1 Tax=Microdochium trichocladiopsis TaxID=1682393 RepID=A0A9P9BR11_9PEZI|nr:uncharacterized protein B0I36DRAFT_330669 [Microdochium trichocladiopsis]KAH7026442.1 hypothetical protein B0I36DRAFT_330669 [Microdochium trichocladiopsis]
MPIFDRARASRCSLDHDRAYGLASLLPKSMKALLAPDYTMSVNDSYKSLARAWIQARADLEILTQSSILRDRDLPSWVPDWRVSEHIRLFSGANCPYDACRSTKGSFAFINGGNTLVVSGLLVDKIDGLGRESGLVRDCQRGVVQPEQRLNAYETTHALFDSLWRTMLGNITTAGHQLSVSNSHVLALVLPLQEEAPGHTGEQRSAPASTRLEQLKRRVFDNRELHVGGIPLGDLIASQRDIQLQQGTPVGGGKDLDVALEQSYRFSRLKRLATTTSGRLAMVPDWTLPGDYIGVLMGSDVPLVLRKIEPGGGATNELSFHVVGGCYVHGLMHGEALESETPNLQEIQLH